MLTVAQKMRVAEMLAQTGGADDNGCSIGGSCRDIADSCSKGVSVCIEYVTDEKTGEVYLVNTAERQSLKVSDK